jgi:hypothetical protein
VDETGLTEVYEVEVRGYGETFDDVIKTLRDQLGVPTRKSNRPLIRTSCPVIWTLCARRSFTGSDADVIAACGEKGDGVRVVGDGRDLY